MLLDFKISEDKLKENNACGVNIMFGDNVITYIKKDGYNIALPLQIVNKFLSDFYFYPDIETLVVSKKLVEEIGEILKVPELKTSISNQINQISLERGYDAQGEVIIEKTLANIKKREERYGLYLIFETVIV